MPQTQGGGWHTPHDRPTATSKSGRGCSGSGEAGGAPALPPLTTLLDRVAGGLTAAPPEWSPTASDTSDRDSSGRPEKPANTDDNSDDDEEDDDDDDEDDDDGGAD